MDKSKIFAAVGTVTSQLRRECDSPSTGADVALMAAIALVKAFGVGLEPLQNRLTYLWNVVDVVVADAADETLPSVSVVEVPSVVQPPRTP